MAEKTRWDGVNPMENIKKILDFNIAGFSVGNLLWAILLLVLCLIVVRLLMILIRKLINRSRLEAGVRSFATSLLRILLYFAALILVADSLGIPISSLLAIFSIAGLAASLAMQDSLSNLASGLMLLISKPFKVGDFIECGSTSGTVRAITLVYTTVATIDNRLVFVPNKDISAARITNFSHEDQRRIDLLFTAAYSAPTASVKAALLHAAGQIPGILQEPAAPFAALHAYKESSIEYILRVWVNTADYWDVYFALMEQVRESFAQYDVETSYDHLNVHIVEK